MARWRRRSGQRLRRGLTRLVEADVEHTVRTYEHGDAVSSAVGYGAEAALALGVEPERVFKTLMVEAGRRYVLCVVPVSGQLDLKAAAQVLGEKQVAMAPPEVAERVSGSVVGGISPLGGRTPLPVVLDESATSYDTILVSAGKRGVDVELSPGELLRVTNGTTASIAR